MNGLNAAKRCDVALGVLSTATPKGLLRRQLAYQTWVPPLQADGRIALRFLVRAGNLTRKRRLNLQREESKLLLIPLSGSGDAEFDGRIAALVAWLRTWPALCPTARWVAKMDDDVYLRSDAWLSALHAIRPVHALATYGAHYFHSWNRRFFSPHSFSWTYEPDEAHRAADYLRGNSSRATNAGYREALEFCRRRGIGECGWCIPASECTYGFPFVTGWLISLSAELAFRLASSPAVDADVIAARSVIRDWGPAQAYEDIWLGYAVHALLSRLLPVSYVNADMEGGSHFINGEWERKRGGRIAWKNTTFVVHNAATRRVHKQMLRAQAAVQPRLECSPRVDFLNFGDYAHDHSWDHEAKGVRGKSLLGNGRWVREWCVLEETQGRTA